MVSVQGTPLSSVLHDLTTVVASRSELEAMAAEWDILAASNAVPMLSHAWIQACAESLYDEDDLHVITVRTGGKLTGAAPLVRRVHAGMVRLELAGVAELYEPSGLLYDTDDALDALLRAVMDGRRPVLLSRIPVLSPIIPRLRSLVRGRGVMFAKPGAGTLAVPISLGWSEFQGQTSSRHRYDLKRARRRAEESGPVTTRIYNPAPEDVAALLTDFARVEASGWKARNGSSLSQRKTLRQFFLNYCTRAAHAGTVRFAFLEVNGRSIAAQLSVVYADRLWVLKIGYDEAWSRCSPGQLLLADTMRDAFDHKLKSYEFLGTDEPWLHRWNTEVRSFSTVTCYPPTFLGLCGLAADTASRAISRTGTLLAGFDRRRLTGRIGFRPRR